MYTPVSTRTAWPPFVWAAVEYITFASTGAPVTESTMWNVTAGADSNRTSTSGTVPPETTICCIAGEYGSRFARSS